jgi:hypothetical protein
MCRKIKATTVTRDTSGKPAFTESMIIEERSDLNITDSVIPKSRSSKRTLKASLMENLASPPFSSTLHFPDKLLGCKLRFSFRRAVVWRHEVMYRLARRTTPEDPRGDRRAPVPRFSLECDYRKFGDVGHRWDCLGGRFALTTCDVNARNCRGLAVALIAMAAITVAPNRSSHAAAMISHILGFDNWTLSKAPAPSKSAADHGALRIVHRV